MNKNGFFYLNTGKKAGRLAVLFVSVCLMALAGGCAAAGRQAANAPFPGIAKWEKLARKSRGYSPSPIRVKTGINNSPGRAKGSADRAKDAALRIRPLPTQKVSLEMRQAGVKAILRALAVSTGVNILVPGDVKGTTSINFTDVPWNQAFMSLLKSYGLSYVWQGGILRVLTLDDMEQSLKAEAVRKKLDEDSPLTTVVVPINYADAGQLQANLEKLLQNGGKNSKQSSRGTVLVDTYSNSLIIQATPQEAKEMVSVIRNIDKPSGQIVIRANIIETTREEARDLGIQWGGVKEFVNGSHSLWITSGGQAGSASSGSSGTSSISAGGDSTPLPLYTPASGATGIGQQGYGVNFPVPQSTILNHGVGSLGFLYGSLAGNILDAQLQALQTQGKINIISSPSITTLDNQQAFTESGTRVPYVTYTFSGSSTTPTVNFVNADLKLQITPHIINGSSLKMAVVIKKDDVDTSREVQGNPFILSKQTKTTLIVKNGATVVISGLTSQNLSSNVNGVPFLKDIPLLGWLFKGESRDNTMNQVLIFLTSYILPREAPVAVAAAHPGKK